MKTSRTLQSELASHMRSGSMFVLVATMLVCTLTAAAVGQSRGSTDAVSVVTQLGERRIYLGDKQLLRFVVTGSRDVVPPNLPSTSECEVQYAGVFDQSSSTTIIINGRMSQQSSVQLAFQYQLSPNQVGIVKIPSLTFQIDSKAYQTDPVEFEVIAVPTSPDSSLTLVCDRSRVYVGEPVPVTMMWRFAGDVQRAQFESPNVTLAEFLPGPDPAPPGAYNADPRFVRLKFGSFEHNARISEVLVDAKRLREVRMDLVLVPSRAGELEVPPVRVLFDAVVGRRAPRPMEFSFGEVPVTERQLALAEPLKLHVLELPVAGRPPHFSGLIGSFSLSAALAQTQASVGEPIDLRVTVSGTHPLSRVPPLDLTSQPIARDFRVPRDPVLSTQARSSVVFDASIRSRRPGSIVVPPIELNYFDSAAGAYKVAASSPLTINVADAPLVSLPDSAAEDSSKGAAEASSSEQSPLPVPDRDLSELHPALAWNPFVESSASSLAVLCMVVALPVGVGLGVWCVRHARRRASPARIRRRAFRAFRRRITAVATNDTGALTDEISAAAREYVSATIADGKKLTSDEAVSLVRARIASSKVGEFENALKALDSARFASAGRLPDESHAASALYKVIADLHRSSFKEHA